MATAGPGRPLGIRPRLRARRPPFPGSAELDRRLFVPPRCPGGAQRPAPLCPYLGVSRLRVRHLLCGAVLPDEPIRCPGRRDLRKPLCLRGRSRPRDLPRQAAGKQEERGRAVPRLPAGGLPRRRSPSRPSRRWRVLLHMALVFVGRQPVGARPRAGLCQGQPARTDSGGKCVCVCVCLSVCFYCDVAGKEKGPQGPLFLFLSCGVLAGCPRTCDGEIARLNHGRAEQRGLRGCSPSPSHPGLGGEGGEGSGAQV